MCALSDHQCNYFWIFNYSKDGEEAAKEMIYFVLSEKSQFATLHCLMDLSKYQIISEQHYFTIFKFQNVYRLIHSFGQEITLKEYMKSNSWIQRDEMLKIINAFIIIYRQGQKSEVGKSDIAEIREKSKLCLGFELNRKLRSKAVNNGKLHLHAIIMKDLSFTHFKASAYHMFDYMDFCLEKLKENIHFDTLTLDPRFRVGYPKCLDDEYMHK
eukprot:83921_1